MRRLNNRIDEKRRKASRSNHPGPIIQAMEALKFSSSEVDGIQVIKLPSSLGDEILRELESEIKQWLLLPSSHFVLDFDSVFTMGQSSLSQLLQFQRQLKKAEKNLVSINLKGPIQKIMEDKGVVTTFAPQKSMDAAKQKFGIAKPKESKPVNAALLSPFIDGAVQAFAVQVKMDVKAGKPSSKKSLFDKSDAVVGQIEVDVTGFSGMVGLCFPEPVFKKIYHALLGEEIEKVDKDSADAAAELLNIIYGHAKTALNSSLGLQLRPALPKVLIHPGELPAVFPVICLPFTSPAGDFRLEIQIGR